MHPVSTSLTAQKATLEIKPSCSSGKLHEDLGSCPDSTLLTTEQTVAGLIKSGQRHSPEMAQKTKSATGSGRPASATCSGITPAPQYQSRRVAKVAKECRRHAAPAKLWGIT